MTSSTVATRDPTVSRRSGNVPSRGTVKRRGCTFRTRVTFRTRRGCTFRTWVCIPHASARSAPSPMEAHASLTSGVCPYAPREQVAPSAVHIPNKCASAPVGEARFTQQRARHASLRSRWMRCVSPRSGWHCPQFRSGRRTRIAPRAYSCGLACDPPPRLTIPQILDFEPCWISAHGIHQRIPTGSTRG